MDSVDILQTGGCTATEDGSKLAILDFGSRGILLSIAKTQALISYAVTAQLICAFDFRICKKQIFS